MQSTLPVLERMMKVEDASINLTELKAAIDEVASIDDAASINQVVVAAQKRHEQLSGARKYHSGKVLRLKEQSLPQLDVDALDKAIREAEAVGVTNDEIKSEWDFLRGLNQRREELMQQVRERLEGPAGSLDLVALQSTIEEAAKVIPPRMLYEARGEYDRILRARDEAVTKLNHQMPPARLDLEALRRAIEAARATGAQKEADKGGEYLKGVEMKLQEVKDSSTPKLFQIDRDRLRSAVDEATPYFGGVAGLSHPDLIEAATRLSQVEGLDNKLLQLLEEEKLVQLVPQLMKHNVSSVDTLAGWQEGNLVRFVGLTKSDARKLKAAAITEQQLSRNCELAVSILQHMETRGHTEYLIETTMKAPDGFKKQSIRKQQRVSEFCELHERISPQLAPRLDPFPFSPWTPRPFHTSGFLTQRRVLLEKYLRQAVQSAKGTLPVELREFLGLPAGEMFTFEPLEASTPHAGGKRVAGEKWEFAAKSIKLERKIGQGGFSTVFEVRLISVDNSRSLHRV